MPAPSLSLIIPGKDAAPYLPTLFESLLIQGQVLADTQIICINDGSTDETPAVLERYGSEFPHFEVITNDAASGLANGRNQGIDAATGEHIAFLDGDDWLPQEYLTTVLEAAQRLDVDFIRTDHTQVEPSGKRTLRRAPLAVRNRSVDPRLGILPTYDSTLVDYPFAWAGVFHSRLKDSGLLYFPKDFLTAEDRSWIWNLHLNAHSFAVVDTPGVCYRRGLPQSLSRVVDERQLQFADAFLQIFALIAADPDSERFWPKAARNWLAILHHQTKRFAGGSSVKLRRDFGRRARAVSEAMPAHVVREAFHASNAVRKAAVLPFLSDRRSLLAEAV